MVPSFVWSTHPVCVPIVSLKRCVLCYSWALLRRPVFRLGLGTGNSLRRSVSLWPRDTIESFPLQGPAVSLQRGTGLQPLLGYHSMSLMSFQFFVVVQSLSHVRFFVTPWTTAHQASLSFTISHSLLKLMSVGDAIQPSHPLWSPSPPAFNLSQHQGLSQWVSSLHLAARVLELQLQSLQWIFRVDFL